MANNMSFTPFPEDAYRLNIAVSKSDLSIDQFFKALYSIHPINCLRCYKTKTYYTVEVYQSTFTVQHNLLCTKCSQTDRLVGYGEIRELRTWVLENYIQYTYTNDADDGCLVRAVMIKNPLSFHNLRGFLLYLPLSRLIRSA